MKYLMLLSLILLSCATLKKHHTTTQVLYYDTSDILILVKNQQGQTVDMLVNYAALDNYKPPASTDIDSLFAYHFKKMDTYVNNHPTDTLYYNCPAQISFMEQATGFEAKADGTAIGRLYFDRNEWKTWHKWYSDDSTIRSKSHIKLDLVTPFPDTTTSLDIDTLSIKVIY